MTYRWSGDSPGEEPVVTWDTLIDLAVAYWDEHPGEEDNRYGPASGMVHATIETGHHDCVSLLSALATTAKDDDAVCFVGAGPIEDLMSHSGHGERFITELESKVAEDERLAAAVASVWLGQGVSDEVRHRLVALGATDLRDPR